MKILSVSEASAAPRRGSRKRFGAAIALGFMALACSLWFLTSAHADETTALVDNARSGWDPNEAGLSPARLKSGRFGKLFDTQIEGQAYAQPLVFRKEVIVATEANEVYGIDASSGIIRWQTKLGTPTPSDCYAASPLLGIHSTPVIDPKSGTLYILSRSLDGADPKYLLNALDALSGHLRDGWPVEIAGHAANDPAVRLDPVRVLQRPALLFLDGAVYAGFGGYCGGYPFRGWVAGINVATKTVTLWTDEAKVLEKSPQAGIWGAGGLVSDRPGAILIATGDGILPPPGDGKLPAGALGNSVVNLQVQSDGSLTATDYFAPSDSQSLNDRDLDLGASAPLVLPDAFAVDGHPHLLFQAGKDGGLFLLDRDDLGGFCHGPNRTDAAVAEAGPFGAVYSHPVAWPGDGGYIYVAEQKEGSFYGTVRAFRIESDGSRPPRLSLAGTALYELGYGTGSPIVTSSGTASGSAIVWLIRHSGGVGQLQAYSAVPADGGVLALLWSGPIGHPTKFSVPATDAGRVFVATADGHLLAFGDESLRPPRASGPRSRSFRTLWLMAIAASVGIFAMRAIKRRSATLWRN